MSNRGLHPQVGILSLIVIYFVIGGFVVLPFYIYLYVQFVVELHRIYGHVRQTRKELRLKKAHHRRSEEISVILKAVSTKFGQITNEETVKLETARAEARKRRSEDVATIVSLVVKQILELQAEEKAKAEKEAAAKLDYQRNVEKAAEQEKLRQNAQRLAELREEKRKAEERERLAALRPQHVTVKSAPKLPSFFRHLDPLSEDFTCIGQTLKRKRCRQWMIAHADKEAAARRLEVMRSKDPGDSFEQAQLSKLAQWMLCPRHHREDKSPQGKIISRQWYIELKPARDFLSITKGSSKAIPVALPKGSNNAFGSPTSVPPSPENNRMNTTSGNVFGLPVTPQKGVNNVFISSGTAFPGSEYSTASTAADRSSFSGFGSPASSIPSFGASTTNTTPYSSTGFPVTPQKGIDYGFGSPASASPCFGKKVTGNRSIDDFSFGEPASPITYFGANTK